jgi:putative MFS transporter
MNVHELLDGSPIKRFHYTILAASFLGWLFDAMNSGLISFVVKPLSQELHLSLYTAGLMLSSWTLGMLVGGFLMGTAADRIGRKPVITAAILLYSIPAGLSGLAGSWEAMFLLRFLAGIGASSFMAVTSTLVSEYFPKRIRGRTVAFLESAWAFGWLLASYLGLVLAPSAGWRSVMLAGLVPMAAAPVFFLLVPESVRFLEKKGKTEEISSILEKGSILTPKESKELQFEAHEDRGILTITELWASAYRRRTLMIWIHWFCIAFAYWGIFLWAPTILEVERGLPQARALQYTLLITVAQIPGYWSGAFLIERAGRRWPLLIYMALAGIGSLLFANATTELEVILWGSVISFFNLGAWGITYAYTPELYPTSMRASGAGWANSMGRIGSILGPIIAGWLLSIVASSYLLFTIFATLFFISAINVLALGVETRGSGLD